MYRRRIVWVALFAAAVAVVLWSYGHDETTAQVSAQAEEGEILYWTCAMHPSVKISPQAYKSGQTKCPICNMDLVQVSAGEEIPGEEGEVTLKLSPRAQRLAGVKTSEVTYLPLTKEIRTVGKIDYDERRQAYVASRIPGRIDRLFVDFTGTDVEKGAPLVSIYSPTLVATQEEYLLALKTLAEVGESHVQEVVEGAKSLAESTKRRLLLWGITEDQIRELERKGKSETHMTIYAPISGTVIHKTVLEGEYVKEGENIYHIAALSNLWIYADIYESEISWMKEGQSVQFTSVAYPGEEFHGRVTFIDPFLDERTRSVKVRVDVPNPGLKLRPGMFANATFKAAMQEGIEHYVCPMHPEVVSRNPGECEICGMDLVRVEKGAVLAVPKSAILDTGKRKIVYVEKEMGVYEARDVVLGPEGYADIDGRSVAYHPVKKGVMEGEKVVTRGNFLVDSQSQLNGPAASMYDAAIGKEEPSEPGHRH